jgi:4-aminobutyrate aminotransferase
MSISIKNRMSDPQTEIPGPRAQAFIERDKRVFTPGNGRVYPFVIDHGEGCYVWDVDGHRYLDMNAGIAVLSAGHSHPRIVHAIQEQATKFTHMAGTDFYNEPMIKVCEKIVSLMPKSAEWQTFLCNSGTEAVEAAIKLARYATGRQGIIAFFGAFHGRTYGSLSLTASKTVHRHGFYPLVAGSYHAFYADPYRRPFNIDRERVTESCLNYIRQTLLTTLVGPDDVAAIIVEPIMGEGGYIVPTPGFLAGLREICDQYGILLIMDEIQSGIGRTGKMWAFEHEDVVPDIVTSAKGLGGGMPLGAMIARKEISTLWEPGSHGTTYGGNGVICAAAYEAISLVEEELMANAAGVGVYLQEQLLVLQSRYVQIGDIRGRGLMVGVDFVKNRLTCEPDMALVQGLLQAAFQRGLLLLPCGASTIRLCPPLILTRAQVDEAISIIEEALKSLLTTGQ